MKKALLLASALLVLVGLAASTQVTVFVIQPIGAVPDGKTLVISRLNVTNFIDSADAVCKRLQGNVNLLCRGMVLGKVGETATVYARLPYSKTLYMMSTGGSSYDR
jgi:hypothetical protein